MFPAPKDNQTVDLIVISLVRAFEIFWALLLCIKVGIAISDRRKRRRSNKLSRKDQS